MVYSSSFIISEGRQRFLLSPLDCHPAKTDGAAGGGAAHLFAAPSAFAIYQLFATEYCT